MSVSAPTGGDVDRDLDVRRDWPQFVALAALTAACTVVVGPLGAAAGLATGVGWYALGTPYAIAIGHVTLVALVPAELDVATVVLLEAGFVALVLASATRVSSPRRFALVALLAVIGLGGVAWLVARSQPLWLAAGAFFAAFGLAAYGLHRYELVQVGLVRGPGSDPSTSADATGAASTSETEIETSTETETEAETETGDTSDR